MKASATEFIEIDVLFKDYYSWLRHRLSKEIGCSASGEDIASDTFVQILSRPVTTPIREPKAFLITIARRLMYQSWRRRDLERAYLTTIAAFEDSASMTLEEHSQIIEVLTTIDLLLDGLKPVVKAAFLLSQIDGLTYPQIASELRVSERSVSEYMKAAFKRCLLAVLEDK